jgi:hypothetical protein
MTKISTILLSSQETCFNVRYTQICGLMSNIILDVDHLYNMNMEEI